MSDVNVTSMLNAILDSAAAFKASASTLPPPNVQSQARPMHDVAADSGNLACGGAVPAHRPVGYPGEGPAPAERRAFDIVQRIL
jgi:hypothetical protein